ncbi:hypothetical protein ANN_14972 [Periplaneta americana]|uniref:Uncharacterized protein n=1 Tax=Periplaneta americana TaxID=6978 RepID=A0ABQ8SXV3_PERAM|nr:hypothetical protein ANN_14972 [Periplaneta americana]
MYTKDTNKTQNALKGDNEIILYESNISGRFLEPSIFHFYNSQNIQHNNSALCNEPIMKSQATKGKTMEERDSVRCCGLNFDVAQWLQQLFTVTSRTGIVLRHGMSTSVQNLADVYKLSADAIPRSCNAYPNEMTELCAASVSAAANRVS